MYVCKSIWYLPTITVARSLYSLDGFIMSYDLRDDLTVTSIMCTNLPIIRRREHLVFIAPFEGKAGGVKMYKYMCVCVSVCTWKGAQQRKKCRTIRASCFFVCPIWLFLVMKFGYIPCKTRDPVVCLGRLTRFLRRLYRSEVFNSHRSFL